jgi:mRNA interferase RelE/StbE
MKLGFRNSFLDDLKRIQDRTILRRVTRWIETLEQADTLVQIAHLKKLKGSGDYYRVRIGDYRLGFSMINDKVCLVRFLPRKDIYKYFP